MPLTAYEASLGPSAETRKKAERLSNRPAAVPVMGALQFLAVVRMLWLVAENLSDTQIPSQHLTNYMGAALGSVMAIIIAVVWLAVAVVFGTLVYGTFTQRRWAWPLGIVFLILMVIAAPNPLIGGGFLGFIKLIAGIAMGGIWIAPSTKDWFGWLTHTS